MPLFNGSIHRNPKRYQNPHELARAIDDYVVKVESGEAIRTIPGLVLHLGMSSKRRLITLALSNPILTSIVETAFTWIEQSLVEDLLDADSGAVVTSRTFLLSNMGYSKSQADAPKQLEERADTASQPSSRIIPGVHVVLVESKNSIPEDEVRRQLMELGGDDADTMRLIDEEFVSRNGQMKTVEASVEVEVVR